MDENMQNDYLNIRYIKLHFDIVFPEDSVLPSFKASSIRGGIGEMLLRANCIRDRKCEECDFETECIVQRTMYSKFEKKPQYVTTGDSVGYVIECEDYREDIAAGETVRFNLILFGKTIVYFNQYLQAVYALGQNGIGKYYSRFIIASVRNTMGQDIISGSNVYMEKYQVHTIRDYVDYRKKQLAEAENLRMIFKTPLTLKYQGEFIKSYNIEAITKAIQRRIYMLDCFENIADEDFSNKTYELPDIINQEARDISVRRYSNRQKSGMYLSGIKGYLEISKIADEELLDMYLAGEIIHIGKNTSFGFGKYYIQ